MFFKKSSFFVILLINIFSLNFNACFCMDYNNNQGRDWGMQDIFSSRRFSQTRLSRDSQLLPQAEINFEEESATPNGSSIVSPGDIQEIVALENLSLEYLHNINLSNNSGNNKKLDIPECPKFPQKFVNYFKKNNASDIHAAVYFNAINWLKAVCVNKSQDDIEKILLCFDDNKNLPMHYAAFKLNLSRSLAKPAYPSIQSPSVITRDERESDFQKKSLEVTKFLLDNGADFILRNKSGENAIIIALKYGNKDQDNFEKNKENCLEFIKLILNNSKINKYKYTQEDLIKLCDDSGKNALYFAIEYWDIDVFNLLLNYCDDLECDKLSSTDLIKHAKSLGQENIAKLIWKNKVNRGKAWPYDEKDECVII